MYLICDFDKTFVRNDFFAEQFFKAFFTFRWINVVRYFGKEGALATKNLLLKNFTPTSSLVSEKINQAVLAYIKAHAAQYDKVILLSASPQFFLDRLARLNKSFDIFDEIHGSTLVNLKGVKKLQYIRDQHWEPYVYIGDSAADEVLFRASYKKYVKVINGKPVEFKL